MKFKVTTETGSYYHIDTDKGRWSKNRGMVSGRIAVLRSGVWEEPVFGSDAWHDVDIPEVGKSMHIAEGLSYWWTTTNVVKVEIDPDDWDERLDY